MPETPPEPDDDPALLDLAGSVSAGSPVDWQAAEAKAGAGRGPVVRALGLIAKIAEVHRSLQRTVILERGEAPAAGQDAGPPVPGLWGHLELQEKVGEGASADVYRARDTRLERAVALKLLRRSPHRGETGNEAVLREGRLLARVRHPNVATVYGADEHDGRVGVWMEYVRGKTVNRLIAEQGPLGAREASLIGIDLCRALAAVHEKGVVHRDLKAQNVMREEGGRILLVDFGIGRDLAGEEEGTPSLSGTPLYLAPETFAGQPATIQSDLYSLGVLLFYLVTAKFPVVGGSLADLRAAHDEGRVTLLRDLRPDLPGWFVQAVEKALARDPAARFASAGQMERALGQMSGTWNRVGELEPGVLRQAKRDRWKPWLIGAAVLALVGLFIWIIGEDPDRTARDLFEEADRIYEQDNDGALALAERAVKLDPSHALAWDLIGTIHGNGGRLDEQHAAADRAHQYAALADEPGRHQILGNYHLVRLDYAKAAAEFEKALQLNPDLARARRQLAMILTQRLDKPAEALKLLDGACDENQKRWIDCGELVTATAFLHGSDQALRLMESIPESVRREKETLGWSEGILLLATGKLDPAQQLLKHLTQSDDTYASEAWLLLSSLSILRGRLLDAREDLERGFAIDLRSDQVTLEARRSLTLAALLIQLNQTTDATTVLDSLDLVPNRPSAARTFAERALMEITLGRRDRAEALYRKLDDFQALNGDNTTLAALALQVSGALALARDSLEAARADLQRARRHLDDVRIVDTLARAEESLGHYPEALRLRETIVRKKLTMLHEALVVPWVLNLFELARDHERSGQIPQAIERYQQFLSLWGETAADLPQVREAKAALARLTSP